MLTAITAPQSTPITSPSVGNRSGYRPDIDGLRSVAVLSVFAYHIRPDWIPAGGIGVDIFFVISGYLIGGILIKEVSEDRFSILRFYERRLRRIFPAMIAMVIATILFSAFVFYPDELVSSGWSVLATIASVANIYFWNTTDYFNETAAGLPLLHMWSLGVEEQFYVFAPLVLILIIRSAPTKLRATLIALGIASLLLSIHQVKAAPTDAFYLPTGRAWELICGVVINTFGHPQFRNQVYREALSLLSSLVLLVSFIVLKPATGWPGLAAIAPVVATAVIIWCGTDAPTIVGRLLATRIPVFFGLISYSLYLWHWPVIIACKRLRLVDEVPKLDILSVLVVAIVMATLSWRFIERPFRNKAMSGRALLGNLGVGSAILVGLSAVAILSSGFPSRFAPREIAFAKVNSDPAVAPYRSCFLSSRDTLDDYGSECLTPPATGSYVLLIGDSHAHMFRSALGSISKLSVLEATSAGCEPDAAIASMDQNSLCGMLLARAIALGAKRRPAAIVISSRWRGLSPAPYDQMLSKLRSLSGTVLVIRRTPEYDVRVPILLAETLRRGDTRLPVKHDDRAVWPLDQKMASLTASKAIYMSPVAAMCRGFSCGITVDREPAYFDKSHLVTSAASIVLSKMFSKNSECWTDLQLTSHAQPSMCRDPSVKTSRSGANG